MTSREYQLVLKNNLEGKFDEVNNEWRSFQSHIGHYAPRVDIAIGPFSTPEFGNQRQAINALYSQNETFLKSLYDFHVLNMANFQFEYAVPVFDDIINFNFNPRCFLAFELEYRNSRKHVLGSVINASALGKIGIGIPLNNATLNTFRRLLNYLSFLKNVDKNTFNTNNFFIVTTEQIDSVF